MVGKDLIMATLLGSGGGSSGSGGSAGVSPKEVNFYDYDGTCVYAYTVAEAQKLSELPAGPEHPGLVFQGWNWSLEGVKGLTRAMNIGAMYTTDDGTTRLYITLQEGRTSPMLGVGVNGTVTVDWGDGTEPDVLTGTSTSTVKWTPNHAYAAPGDYVIRLTVDGSIGFAGAQNREKGGGTYLLRHSDSSSDTLNCVYQSAIRKIEFGANVETFGLYALDNCLRLVTITMPIDVLATRFGKYAFAYCQDLKAVSLPPSITICDSCAFNYCRSIGVAMFNEGLGSLGGSVFQINHLGTITIPDSVTTIGSYAFTGLNYLDNATISANAGTIETRAFYQCFNARYFDFSTHASVPSLSAVDAFTGIPSDCEIRVPAALYDEWIAATNWATYASNIKAY